MQEQNNKKDILANRKEPPMADQLASRIIYATANMPQERPLWWVIKDFISAKPAQVAFASLALVLLTVTVLSNNEANMMMDQSATPQMMVEVQGPSGYEDFAQTFEQETLSFMVADLN